MKVEKKVSEFRFEVKEVSENGTFEGYGAVFNNIDYGYDRIRKGAFTRSIAELKSKGRKLPILWQHKSDEPLGTYDLLEEDDYGLKVRGQLLIQDVAKAREGYALMKAGAVTGLSIGYGVQKYQWNEEEEVRDLLDLDLWEISQVTFPMNDAARIDAIKHMLHDGKLPSLKEFEDFLREAGFSKSQATAIAGNGLSKLLRSESVAETEAKKVAELLSNFKLPNIGN